MKNKCIKFLNHLITEETTKKELDIIEYCKKCVRSYGDKEVDTNATFCLEYLNQKAGTHYRPVESNLKFIKARLKDYTESDLKAVIDKKVAEWKGTDMQMYLRPETLFNATKFESYKNGLENKKKPTHEKNKDLNRLFDSLEDFDV